MLAFFSSLPTAHSALQLSPPTAPTRWAASSKAVTYKLEKEKSHDFQSLAVPCNGGARLFGCRAAPAALSAARLSPASNVANNPRYTNFRRGMQVQLRRAAPAGRWVRTGVSHGCPYAV